MDNNDRHNLTSGAIGFAIGYQIAQRGGWPLKVVHLLIYATLFFAVVLCPFVFFKAHGCTNDGGLYCGPPLTPSDYAPATIAP